jgi:2-methylisocitrate lyase-like PEP mutase family enzyme
MTTPTTQADRARAFDALHRREELLLLANAWDAISARIIAAAGFPAIATTSSGVAAAVGYPDGEGAPLDEIVAATARIARAVDVPVTADIESGFGATASDVAETVRRIINAGAVGVNLEDVIYPDGRLFEVPVAAERVRAARRAADAEGVPLYLNARTDVFLLKIGEPAGRTAEALRRARAFLDAGASGIFIPGVVDAATIGALASQIDAPLNVLAQPGIPSRADLRALGVHRVSLGSSPMRATMAFVRALAAEIRDDPGFAYLERAAIPYAEVNTLSMSP